ncbi:MAG TPA: hypothetical protein VHA06_12185 [Candidatus Angelobacter sp.]|jgi:hypothetical protein|nr:hypothetical protein [Candidatus Angelobacter sp.]
MTNKKLYHFYFEIWIPRICIGGIGPGPGAAAGGIGPGPGAAAGGIGPGPGAAAFAKVLPIKNTVRTIKRIAIFIICFLQECFQYCLKLLTELPIEYRRN